MPALNPATAHETSASATRDEVDLAMKKLRQRLRSGLLVLALLLFPLTLNYFSPYLIVEGAALGFLSGSAVVFMAMFVCSVLVGRLWCGWACPGAGLMESLFGFQPKRFRLVRGDGVKWIIWAPWVATIVFLLYCAGGPTGVRFFHRIEGGISTREPADFVKFYGVVALFAIPSLLVGKRAGCHVLCWMAPFMILGRRLGRGARIPSLHLAPTTEACAQCRSCEQNCPMSLDVSGLVESGSMYHAECILCGSCVDTCAKSAIAFSFGQDRRPPRGAAAGAGRP